jgi:hypothetical protein
MLRQPEAEKNLTRLVTFLKQRIDQFANIDTPLGDHFIKNLEGLFARTRYLYSNVLTRIRVVQNQVPTQHKRADKNEEKSGKKDLESRPYFHPIEVRTLLSPTLMEKEQLEAWQKQSKVEEQTQNSSPKQTIEQENIASTDAQIAENVAPELKIKTAIKEPVRVKQLQQEPASVNTPEEVKNSNVPEQAEPQISSKVIVKNKSALTPDKPQAIKKENISRIVEEVVKTDKADKFNKADKPDKANEKVEIVPPVKINDAEMAKTNEQQDHYMRPMAVMIENHRRARPQSGLIDAEVVYEMPVEGGITRFMALYFHIPGVLGPVRSCREYFVDRALEVNAMYAHCGASPKGYAYLSKSGIDSIDEISNGKPFYRFKRRKAPHNLYTKGKRLYDYVSKKFNMKLQKGIAPLNYGSKPTIGEKAGKNLYIRYHGNYNTSYKYENGVYKRYMNGQEHVDLENGRHIMPGTVILQVAKMKTVDKAGRQEISFIGEGSAIVFYKGTLINCRWQKQTANSMTRYITDNGNQVVFSQQKPVWIQVVSPRHKVKINQKTISLKQIAAR